MSKSSPDEKVQTQENKQLIGSSKRKRKASIIKRNILVDETNDTSKNEKTSKKIKTEKIKTENEKEETLTETVPEPEQEQTEPTTPKLENQTENAEEKDEDDEPLGKKQRANKKPSNCNSSKQECQNCSFCSEHKPGGEPEIEDVKKKKFTCDTCAKMGIKKVYNSLDKYTDHINLLHEKPKDDIKKFECTDCPEPVWFPTKSKYCYHLGAKHPGIIKFICEVCTETFKLKANYKNHMKTHNIVVQKKFQCDVCMGTFVNRAGYEAHKKRFPGPHIKQNCSHCGFSFSREKHMRNHRCKKLLLEEAARNAQNESGSEIISQVQQTDDTQIEQTGILTVDDNIAKEISTDVDLLEKKNNEFEKRVVFHRIVPRRNQEQTIYRPVQMQAQNVPESVVVQELREIDIDGNTFIATDTDQQIILRDVNGHIVQGNQILQLDLNDVQPGEESQVYLADWNVVAPFVIREKSP